MMGFKGRFAAGLWAVLSVFSCVVQADTKEDATAQSHALRLDIVTTNKPIGLIAHDIAGELARVEVLLPDNASPHDYALKPSDIKTLSKAAAVFWVGPEIEPFLTKLLSQNPNALQLMTYPGMPVQHFDDHQEKPDHKKLDDHDHSHQGLDGHIWLGPDQSKMIAKAIALTLIEKDPKNAASYRRNLDNFVKEVETAKINIQSTFDAQPVKGYILFHDGYGYFESAFGLKPTGHITASPERKAGARTLVTIRAALQNKKAQCVFSESQFNPAVIKRIAQDTGAKVVMLDPMAKDLNLDQHRYVDFLMAIGKSYQLCFSL